MKKLLTLILALAIICSLASLIGCSKTAAPETTAAPAATAAPGTLAPTAAPAAETPSDEITPETLKKSKPNAYVQEKIDAGMEVLVGCSMVADVPILMQDWGPVIQKAVEEKGCKWAISAANGDVALMISQIENYVTMGAACIVVVPPDANSIKETVLAAMDKGTDVVCYGVAGCDYCFSTRKDSAGMGVEIGKMAVAWAHQRYPDMSAENPVKFASFNGNAVIDVQQQSEGTMRAIEADPACALVFKADVPSAIDDGFTGAQNAMTSDPEIRVFGCHDFLCAEGANNYIMSQPGYDKSEFGVFGSDYDAAGEQMIKTQSPKNEAVMRGSVTSEFGQGVYIANITLVALFEAQEAPYEKFIECFAFTAPDFPYTIPAAA